MMRLWRHTLLFHGLVLEKCQANSKEYITLKSSDRYEYVYELLYLIIDVVRRCIYRTSSSVRNMKDHRSYHVQYYWVKYVMYTCLRYTFVAKKDIYIRQNKKFINQFARDASSTNRLLTIQFPVCVTADFKEVDL